MERLLQDLRFAVRALRKSPGFTAVAVLSLGLGIGANTAIFSLIHAVMLRALPVEQPGQLVILTDPGSAGVMSESSETGERSLLAWQEFDALRKGDQVFQGMFAMQSSPRDTEVRVEEGRFKAQVQLASGEFFEVLGVRAALGRVFAPEEDRLGANNAVAVISYACWERQFAGARDVLGKTLLVGRGGFTIVGVAPRDFRGAVVGSNVDVWIPLSMQATVVPGHDYLAPRDTLWLQVMARLKPGVPLETAQAGINVAFQQILRGWAGSLPTERERKGMLDQKIALHPGARGSSMVRSQFGDPLVLLMAMVGVVLLIACANIANLTLARATGRRKEFGVRMALGAGRVALVRQMLTESLVVAVAGGAAGWLLASWGADTAITVVSGASTGIVLDGRQDGNVLLFTLAASLATMVLCGLAPALRATRVDVNRLLAAAARGALGDRRGARAGRLLVVAQVALSLLLLVGAGLLVRSLYHLSQQDLGIDRDHLVVASLDTPAAGYKGAAADALFRRLEQHARTIPGVRSAALSDLGLFGGDSADLVSVEGYPGTNKDEMHAYWTLVGANYFATVGTRVVRGREISESDATRGLAVCVINQSLAKFFFKNTDPIGKHITDEHPTTRTTYEIVGVVADAHDHSLTRLGERRFYGNVFHPIGALDRVTLVLRTAGDPGAVVEGVRQMVRAVDPALPVTFARTVNDQIGRRLVAERMMAQLAACFGALALLMAAVGMYGVMSYAIGRRTSEIGLRMALGASQGGVMRMVLRESALMAGAGVGVGLPCALAAARLIRSALPGVSPADPPAIAGALAIILAATLLAGYLPARRASRVDPMEALRCE